MQSATNFRIYSLIFGLLLSFLLGPGCSERVAPTEVSPLAGPQWRPGYERPEVIDLHGHIYPEGADRLSRIMNDNGLSVMVNLSGGSPTRGMDAQRGMKIKGAQILHFMNIDWRIRKRDDFGAILAKSLHVAVNEYGYRGVKASKALGLYIKDADGQRLPVDTPLLDPLWEAAGALGVPVAIHTSDPKAFWQPLTPENERYAELKVHPKWSFAGSEWPSREQLLAERERLVARHPKTTFICVHFGNNPEDLAFVDGFMDRNPNVILDTAARLGEIGRHPAKDVRAFFIKHQDRIVFGTDIGVGGKGLMLGSSGDDMPTMADVKPFYEAHWRFFEGDAPRINHPTPIQGDWKIDAINLPESVLYKLYRGNAMRLLRLGSAPDDTIGPLNKLKVANPSVQ